MFIHIFKNRLKCLIHDRQTLFWTLLFPIFLATFFYMAFSNLNSHDTFKAINVAVIDDDQYKQNQDFKLALEQVSQGDNKLFNLTVTSMGKAEQLLSDNTIKGYIVVGKPIKLIVKDSGLSQNIIKSFIDSYSHTASAVTSILKEKPMKAQELINELGNRQEYIKEVSGTSAPPNNVLNYFYSLIAMACFYGSLMGNREIINIQANLSTLAARINVAPVHKLKVFLYNMSAALLIHFVEMLVLLAYLRCGLNIDFGSKTGYVLLTTFIGSVTGLSFGAFISAAVKKGEGIKTAIIIASTMLGSFLAGMMYESMKYIISQNVPVLSYLNPVNLLTDAFYCLYYYDTFSKYTLNIISLCIFIGIFCSGTYLIIRRSKYASI